MAFGGAASTLALLERGLDTTQIGLVVLGAGADPVLITAGAARLLDAYFGKRKGRGLPDPVGRWLATHAPLRSGELPPVASSLVATNGERQLVVRLRHDGDRRVLLLEERPPGVCLESLAPLGLSRRQAEVLRWVAVGKTDSEAATILGLSARTVHHHLEQVYRWLGVENRTAAARLAVEAAASWPQRAGGLQCRR